MSCRTITCSGCYWPYDKAPCKPIPSWDWQLTIHSTKKGFSFVQTDCHGVEVHRGDVSLTTMERLLPILITYKVLL